mgnify:CR=1 FL=1
MKLHRAYLLVVFVVLCTFNVILASKNETERSNNGNDGLDKKSVSGQNTDTAKSLPTPLPAELILTIASFLMNVTVTPSILASEVAAVWVLCNCAFIHNNFPVYMFTGKFKYREGRCLWKVAPHILRCVQAKQIKLPKYCALLGDFAYHLALLRADHDAHRQLLISRLDNLRISFAQRSEIAHHCLHNVPVKQLISNKGELFRIVFRFINKHEFGDTVYRVAMTQPDLHQAHLLGHLMAFSLPMDCFANLSAVGNPSQIVGGFLAAPVVPYSDWMRRGMYDRNKKLIRRHFANHHQKGILEDINSIRFAGIEMVSSVVLSVDFCLYRAGYYALVYSCHGDKPDLFKAWSELFSTLPSMTKLEHELIFVKQSLDGQENCGSDSTISSILDAFESSCRFIENCASEAFISLWYSIVKAWAINNRTGPDMNSAYLDAYPLAETVKEKELFAKIIVEHCGSSYCGEKISFLIYDPIFIKQALTHSELHRKHVVAYFAYSVMHSIPELIELIFQKYGASATERRKLCNKALKSGLIPPAFKTALLKVWVYSNLLEYFAASRIPSSNELDASWPRPCDRERDMDIGQISAISREDDVAHHG